MKKLFILLIILVIIAFAWEKSSTFFPNIKQTLQTPQDLLNKNESVKILHEENVVIDVVKNSGPSVITIGIKRDTKPQNDPLSLFFRTPTLPDSDAQDTEDYIGSGFVIQKDGLIVTNKHVVGSTNNTYYVFNESGEKFEVEIFSGRDGEDANPSEIERKFHGAVESKKLKLNDFSSLK